MKAELVLDAQCLTGESPVWHAQEQALYWVDIPNKQLHRWRLTDHQHQCWTANEMTACIALAAHPAGAWIAGMESGVFLLQPQQTEDGVNGVLNAQPIASVTHAAPGMRFNDGRCDRQGRFWAGTMVMDMSKAQPTGCIYRLHAPSSTQPLPMLSAQISNLIVPNGMAFSPDGRTMYLSDSHPQVQKIWAFDFDTDTGTPHSRRLFVDMAPMPGRPDGAAVDVDGCYWICGNDAGLIHRFTPAGKLDRSLAVPVKKPAMCAFGGHDYSTLYVTSIRPSGDLSEQPLAGGVFALRPGVQGLPEPAYLGH